MSLHNIRVHGILEIGWIDENGTLGQGLASTRLEDFVRDILYTCWISQSLVRPCTCLRCLQCQLHIEAQ